MQRGNILLVIALVFSGFSLSAQENSLKEFNLLKEINVFTKEEESLFSDMIKNGTDAYLQDYLKLMILSGNSKQTNALTQSNNKINEFLTKGNFQDKKQLVTAKSIKKFYKTVHDDFLTQYKENPPFTRIFEDGIYNCATASALYAYLLDTLDINYQIMETPTHVYIIARPENRENIIFETTTPAATVLQFNERMKQQYVDYLYSNKQISKEEWLTEDKKTLFDKYFYSDKEITLRQLTGLLYYNQGIAFMLEEDYLAAWKCFEKNYILYPEPKTRYLVNACLGNFLLKTTTLSEEEQFPYYLRFSQIGKQEIVKELVGSFINNISKKYLLQYPDINKYHSIYNRVIAAFDDSTTLSELNYQHYYNLAHYHYLKNDYDSISVYANILYKKNDKDLLVQNLISGVVGRNVNSLGDFKKSLEFLDSNFNTYPFLKKDEQLNSYYQLSLAALVAQNFDAENVKEGNKYLSRLKAYLQAGGSIGAKNQSLIASAIGEVSGYYVRKGDYNAAKELLEIINKAMPGNEEIIRRLEHVSKYAKK